MLYLDGSLNQEHFSLKVNFEVARNKTVSILGPNGSGKSTLLKIINGLEKLTSGELKIDTKVMDSGKTFVEPRHRNVGWVPQNQVLFNHLTVKQNVEFSPRSSKEKACELIDLFELTHLQERKAGSCSGGESQRVAIARAIASKPKILLLDEPSTGLDEKSKTIIHRYLKTQREITTLLVTHDPLEAASLSEHLLILENGLITQSGSPNEVKSFPATAYSASLVELNFVTASADGLIATTEKGVELILSEPFKGLVNIVIPPKAIALYREKPAGSPRNVLQAEILEINPIGQNVRVNLEGGINFMAEITQNAFQTLKLRAGDTVWAAFKATELITTME